MLPCPWAEMEKSRPRREPIRLLNSLPCALGKNINSRIEHTFTFISVDGFQVHHMTNNMVFIGNSISYKFRQTKTQKRLSCNLQETLSLPLIVDTFDGFFVAQLDWYVTRIEKNPSEASVKMRISQRSFAQKLV